MKKLIIILLLALTAAACGLRKSELKQETGYVIERQFYPDSHETVVGTGYSSNGNIIVTTHQMGDSEKYMLVFKCEHGRVFSINNSNLFALLNKNDTVRIYYQEVLNRKNKIVDFDFVNATKK